MMCWLLNKTVQGGRRRGLRDSHPFNSNLNLINKIAKEEALFMSFVQNESEMNQAIIK